MASGSDDRAGPLWLIPLPVGELRRVGDFEAHDASFFSDGRIAFTQGTALFVAEKNGSNPRKLAGLDIRPVSRRTEAGLMSRFAVMALHRHCKRLLLEITVCTNC